MQQGKKNITNCGGKFTPMANADSGENYRPSMKEAGRWSEFVFSHLICLCFQESEPS